MTIIMGWVKLSRITGKSEDNIVLQLRALSQPGQGKGAGMMGQSPEAVLSTITNPC
jgi:hypothetical protein